MLNLRYPIIQAGMAGGVTKPELVAAVSEAGGLGTLGAGYMSPAQLQQAIQQIQELTTKPFAVNLFIPEPFEEDQQAIDNMQKILKPYRQKLQLPPAPRIPQYTESFLDQLEVILKERISILSFTFGMPDKRTIFRLKQNGITLIGTATTVREAIALEKSGIDMVVAQGSEAGGHRGSFLDDPSQSLIGAMALIPQIVDHVQIPVIAAGGIMDGRGMAAAFALGAQAVQVGTAFLTCLESGAHPIYKEAILHSTEEGTKITRAFSGKPARGIRNEFMEKMDINEKNIPPYPIQHALTRDIRQAAAKQEQEQFMSLWAGQACRLAKTQRAEEIIQSMIQQFRSVSKRLTLFTDL